MACKCKEAKQLEERLGIEEKQGGVLYILKAAATRIAVTLAIPVTMFLVMLVVTLNYLFTGRLELTLPKGIFKAVKDNIDGEKLQGKDERQP
jgi:hypothetical protein